MFAGGIACHRFVDGWSNGAVDASLENEERKKCRHAIELTQGILDTSRVLSWSMSGEWLALCMLEGRVSKGRRVKETIGNRH